MGENWERKFAINTERETSPDNEIEAEIEPEQPKSREQIFHEALKRGELPQELAEAWRIVEPGSSEGQKFQELIESAARPLYESEPGKEHYAHAEFRQHDFDAQPVKFLLAKESRSNAWYVTGSQPPIIVFTEGIFQGEEALIKSPNDLAAVICHEMTHVKMREVLGSISDSKAEEGLAYALPIMIIADKGKQLGLNPERLLEKDTGKGGGFFDNLTKQQSKAGKWQQYVDVHPSVSTLTAITRNTLAYVRKEKGSLVPEVPEVKPYTKEEQLIQTIRNSRHESYIEKSLQRYADYQQASSAKKVEILGSILDTMREPWSIRAEDLAGEIKKLRSEIRTPEERQAIHTFADKILQLGEKGHYNAMRQIYIAAGRTLTGKWDIVPLGRLRSIASHAEAVVDTVTRRPLKPQLVIEAAKNLTRALEGSPQKPGEPLFQTAGGREFLNVIDWPQFPMPDESQAERNRRRDQETPVAWAPLIRGARRNTAIAKVAAYLGLAQDPYILEAICERGDLVMELANPKEAGRKGELADALPHMSIGPREGSTTLADIEFSAPGRMIGFDVSGKMAEENSLRRVAIFKRYADAWIEEKFLESNTNPQAKEMLLKSGDFFMETGVEFQRLPALDVCEHNFPLFLQVNRNRISVEWQAAAQLVGVLREKNDREMIRHLFFSTEGKEIMLNSLNAIHFISTARDTAALTEGTFVGREDIVINPFMRLLVDEKNTALSPQEKLSLCEGLLQPAVTDTSRDAQFHNMAMAFDYKRAQVYIKYLAPLLAAAEVTYSLTPATWGRLNTELTRLGCNEQGQLNIVGSSLYCEAFLLLHGNTLPTIPQITRFAELVGTDYIAGSQLQLQLRDKMRRRFQNFAERSVKTSDLVKTIQYWRLASRSELLFPETSDAILNVLVSRVEKLNDGSDRGGSECFIRAGELIQAGRILDPNFRRRTIETWAAAAQEKFGRDTGEESYSERVLTAIDAMTDLSRADRAEVLAALAKQLQVQHPLARELRGRAYEVTADVFEANPFFGIITDTALGELRKKREYREATLDYLTTPLSEDSVQEFIKRTKEVLEFRRDQIEYLILKEDPSYEKDPIIKEFEEKIAARYIRSFHENFWVAPLEARAVMIRELLVSPVESVDEVDEATFAYAINKTFGEAGPYAEATRTFIRAYVDSLPHYQKHLCLGAMMAATERRGGESGRIGEALAFFAENMGPAETKVGQAAQSHPLVPPEIREDLKRLKFRAGEPPRWEITRLIENARADIEAKYNQSVSATEAARLERIGDLVGSGSIYLVAEVTMSDGKSYMLSVTRPHAQERGQDGFSTMRRMTDNLTVDDPHNTAQVVRELVDQASQRLEIETDPMVAPIQYANARNMYSGATIDIDGQTLRCEAADVITAGDDFFMMSTIQGEHFIELPEANSEERERKKRYAMATLAFELNNILRGKFDSDRHGGNIKIDEANQQIGHFDFKQMAIEPWSPEGYEQFARLFVGAASNANSAGEFIANLAEQERTLRNELQAEDKAIHPFVLEAQKALLTNSEYINSLDERDIARVVISAALNGLEPSMETALIRAVEKSLPAETQAAYRQQIEPAIRNSLETGQLSAELQQLLPAQVSDSDIIRINRPAR